MKSSPSSFRPIQDGAYCGGCGACAHICPAGAIEMSWSEEGFQIPRLKGACLECGTCERICPFVHPDYAKHSRPAIQTLIQPDPWAAFREVGRGFLDAGGLVCGPAFNSEMDVEHIVISDPSDLNRLGLNGPIESRLHPCLSSIEEALNSGRRVLFGGAPCLVAGLLAVMKGWRRLKSVPGRLTPSIRPFGGASPQSGRGADRLFTVDIACSGVVTGGLFKRYLRENFDQKILSAKFGGHTAQPNLELSLAGGGQYRADSDSDLLLKIIRRGLAPRPACGHCPFNRRPRQGDLSLWGDGAQVLAAINSLNGAELAGQARPAEAESPAEIEPDHPLLALRPRVHRNRRLFFEGLARETLAENVAYNLDGQCDCIVLNFWHTPNYGGVLTAFALQEILKELGQRPRLAFCHVVASLYEGNFQERFAARRLALTHRCSCLSEVMGLNDLTDTFIVGSDQVWRYEFCHNFNEIYYLGFVRPGHKKIACSVSFGRSQFDADPENTERIGRLIADFDAISVREKDGVKICRETFKTGATHLADPVLALAPEKYEALIQSSRRKDRGFIAVYGVDGSYDPELRKLSAKLNKPLVHIKNVEVEDWLYLVKNCDFLATGSFHGTCFALLFNRPFIYCQTPGALTVSRLESLLPDFGQTSRHIRPGEKLSDLGHLFSSDSLDSAKINQITDQKRADFLRWLKAALQKGKNSDLPV